MMPRRGFRTEGERRPGSKMGGKSRKKIKNQKILIPAWVFLKTVRNSIKKRNAKVPLLVAKDENGCAYSLGFCDFDSGGGVVFW